MNTSRMLRKLSYTAYKIKSSLKRRGVYGTFIVLPLQLIWQRVQWNRGAGVLEEDFDKQYGVDTEDAVELYQLDVDTAGWQYGTRYQPGRPYHFKQIIESLKINYEDFVFFDFGSGKGRALLLASEFPFKRIIGVELSSQLHQIALQNIARYSCQTKKYTQIESVCMDASTYRLPAESAVIYLHNPFYEEVMVKVLVNFRRSLQEHPGKMIIVYHVPVWDALFAKADFLRLVAKIELPRRDNREISINERVSIYTNI